MKVPDKWIITKDDERCVDLKYPWIQKNGDDYQRFVEKFFRPKSGIDYFELQQWQLDYAMRLLCWVQPNSVTKFRPKGLRRALDSHLGIPRQQGKSWLISSLCYFFLTQEPEINPEIVMVAVKESQIHDTIFKHISHSIYQTDLQDEIHVKQGKGDISIYYPHNNGYIRCLTQGGNSKLGASASLQIYDEFSFHENYDIYNNLIASATARDQPLTITVSSAGRDRTTPGYARWCKARGIIKGLQSDINFLPLIYENDESNTDYFSEDTLRKCNPAWDSGFMNKALLMREAKMASESKQEEMRFRCDRLSEWVSSTNSHINLDAWQNCKVEKYPDFPKGTPIFLGADLATTTDLVSGIGLIPYEGKYYVVHKSWGCWHGAILKDAVNKQRYENYERDGLLHMYEGDVIDPEGIRDWLKSWSANGFKLMEINFDPTKNALDTMLMLEKEGYKCRRFIASNKNYNGPMRRLQELVLSGKLRHKGDDMLNWQVQNFESKVDGDLVFPIKPTAGSMKRDLMIALVIACDSLIELEPKQTKYRKIQYW